MKMQLESFTHQSLPKRYNKFDVSDKGPLSDLIIYRLHSEWNFDCILIFLSTTYTGCVIKHLNYYSPRASILITTLIGFSFHKLTFSGCFNPLGHLKCTYIQDIVAWLLTFVLSHAWLLTFVQSNIKELKVHSLVYFLIDYQNNGTFINTLIC